jgi:hypothetical protein
MLLSSYNREYFSTFGSSIMVILLSYSNQSDVEPTRIPEKEVILIRKLVG